MEAKTTGVELYKRIEDKMAILKNLLDTKIDDLENMTHDDQVHYNRFLTEIDKYSVLLAGRLTKAHWMEGLKNNEHTPYGTVRYAPEHVFKYDHETGKWMHRHTSWGRTEWNECDMNDIPEDRDFEFTKDIGGRASADFMRRCGELGL